MFFINLIIPLIASSPECSTYTDCYNCTASYYFNNENICKWSNGVCGQVPKNESVTYFWEPFEECTDYQSVQAKNTYCGEEDLGSNDIIKIEIPKVDGRYATQNILCKYSYTNLNEKKSLVLVSKLDTSAFKKDAAFYFYVKFVDGTTAVRNIDKENYKVTIESSRTLEIYLAFKNSISVNPITLSIESEEAKINITLIITIILIIIACIICSVSIYLFSKRLARKREIQNIINRELELANAQQNGLSQRGLVNPTELIKQRRKEQLAYVLKNVIKPTQYSDDIGKYNLNCTICLDDFKTDSIVGVTKCSHVFHYNCLKTWLTQNLMEPKCPNCNMHILPEITETKENVPINNNQNNNNQMSNEPTNRIQFHSHGGNITVSQQTQSNRNNFVQRIG